MRPALVAVGLLLLLGVPVHADTLVLKGGMKLEGEIVRETDSAVVLKLKSGGRTTIQRAQIEEIIRAEVELDPPPAKAPPPARPPQVSDATRKAILAARRATEERPPNGERIVKRIRGGFQLLIAELERPGADRGSLVQAAAALLLLSTDGLNALHEDPSPSQQKAWFTAIFPGDDDTFTTAEWKEMEKLGKAVIAMRARQEIEINANETAAVGTLVTLRSAQALHRKRHGRFGERLEDLGKLVDPAFARSGIQRGYRFQLRATETSWVVVASPVEQGKTGRRSFAATPGGRYFEADAPVLEARLPFQAPSGARAFKP